MMANDRSDQSAQESLSKLIDEIGHVNSVISHNLRLYRDDPERANEISTLLQRCRELIDEAVLLRESSYAQRQRSAGPSTWPTEQA